MFSAASNRVCALFGIQYPIIQAGMVWCSGWRLASVVSRKGGLGLLGAGSMYPETLRTHIRRLKGATDKPFGVNIPLLYPDIEKLMAIVEHENVPVVFTSAGNPAAWTAWLKQRGITVVHVAPTPKLARKCEEKGVDAVVCEGFEAGGHNGKDEITSMCLIPQVADAVSVPVIAAGGIGDGRGIAAAFALGAEGVQIGSRFAATQESSAHQQFKEAVRKAAADATVLSMKELVPVRLLKNSFYERVKAAEQRCAAPDELKQILGKRRAKAGIFEGDLTEGELEIGQISGLIHDVPAAGALFDRLLQEYRHACERLPRL